MIWKVIGQSVIGSSHTLANKGCEDALSYEVVETADNQQVLIAFVSDGAGSAKFAAEASTLAVHESKSIIKAWINDHADFDESSLYQLAECIYINLKDLAKQQQVPINEFSCTFLGSIIFVDKACFLQIGDGAIVRNDGSGYFTPIWWPHNGEYQNTTTFLIDDPALRNLKTLILKESITEVALFSDGIQLLALNTEAENVHQPFFNDLFKWLRKASTAEHVAILNNKLKEYLSGSVINNRTDDDKTLLLATKLKDDSSIV